MKRTDKLCVAPARSQILLQAATALGWSITPQPEGSYYLTPPASKNQEPTRFNARGLDLLDDGPTSRAEMARVLGALVSVPVKHPRADSDEMDAIRARLAALETWMDGVNKTLDHIGQTQGEIARSFKLDGRR